MAEEADGRVTVVKDIPTNILFILFQDSDKTTRKAPEKRYIMSVIVLW